MRCSGAAYKRRSRESVITSLPIEPLRELLVEKMAAFGWDKPHAADRLRIDRRQLHRLLYESTNVYQDTVDKVCLALGTHPAIVYGHLWDLEVA